jgi:uncharacterized HAD superfamily protein
VTEEILCLNDARTAIYAGEEILDGKISNPNFTENTEDWTMHGNEVMQLSPRLRLGIDWDDVVYSFVKQAKRLLKTFTGRQIPDPTRWMTGAEHWGLSKEEWNWLWSEEVRHELYCEGEIPIGTAAMIRSLRLYGDIIFITARNTETKYCMMRNMDKNRISYDAVHFEKEKWTVPCDLYLDDNPVNLMNIRDFATKGPMLLLWDKPWNREDPDLKKYGIVRVFSWEDVLVCTKMAHLALSNKHKIS